ncbi:hypothetical protein [Aliikangiella sp. IMCC44632]
MNKTTLSIVSLAFFCSLSFLSQTANAANEATEVQIKVEKESTGQSKVNLVLDGSQHTFTLPQLQEEETQVITTQEGANLNATRNNDKIKIEVEGKTVDIPVFKGDMAAKLHRAKHLSRHDINQVTVSGVELNDEQKEIIKQAFISAGVTKKVEFANSNLIVIKEMSDDVSLNSKHCEAEDECEFEVILDDNIGDKNGKTVRKIIIDKK